MANESTQSRTGLVKRVRADGRCVYEWEAKLAIVRAALAPGASKAKVALQYGINANLLRKWIVKHGATAGAESVLPKPSLLPVVVARPSMSRAARRSEPAPRERTPIEVDLPRGVLRFYGAIDRAVLRDLIEALSLR